MEASAEVRVGVSHVEKNQQWQEQWSDACLYSLNESMPIEEFHFEAKYYYTHRYDVWLIQVYLLLNEINYVSCAQNSNRDAILVLSISPILPSVIFIHAG